ncbi:MAG: hypothetical protein ACRENE_25970 [Polyangiaceae bacterium]
MSPTRTSLSLRSAGVALQGRQLVTGSFEMDALLALLHWAEPYCPSPLG